MAGRARTKALTEELETRTNKYFDGDPATTLDYVCARIEGGTTVKAIAQELTDHLTDEVTYDRLMAVLRAAHGEELTTTSLSLARTRASHSMAEDALVIVDQECDTNVEVSRAASRARTRQWIAERWNRKEYGQDKGVSVSVTVGSLHLDALRAPTVIQASVIQPALPAATHASPPSGVMQDAEIISE